MKKSKKQTTPAKPKIWFARLWPWRLASDYKRIVKKSWSVRILAIAVVLTIVDLMLQVFGTRLPIPEFYRTLICAAFYAAAFGARLVAQSAWEK